MCSAFSNFGGTYGPTGMEETRVTNREEKSLDLAPSIAKLSAKTFRSNVSVTPLRLRIPGVRRTSANEQAGEAVWTPPAGSFGCYFAFFSSQSFIEAISLSCALMMASASVFTSGSLPKARTVLAISMAPA